MYAQPFHAGELQVQSMVGVSEVAMELGLNMIEDSIPFSSAALKSFNWIFISSVDEEGELVFPRKIHILGNFF